MSTSDPTMSAAHSLEVILKHVKSSNLSFQIQQSHFSATISLRKSFIKDKFGVPLESPLPDTDHLKHGNRALKEKVSNLEKKCFTITRNLEEAFNDSENAYKTISKLENDLDDRLEQVKALTTFNKKLELENYRSENEMKKLTDDLERETNKKRKLEKVVNEVKLALKENKKSLKQSSIRNESLELIKTETASELKDLSDMVKARDDEIKDLKAASIKPPVISISQSNKSTNTPFHFVSTTATQCETNVIISKGITITRRVTEKCTHSAGCFLRQPRAPPPTFLLPKYSHISPPTNIRLLPFSVDTYQDFRKLHFSLWIPLPQLL